jgi:hypothetical protein
VSERLGDRGTTPAWDDTQSFSPAPNSRPLSREERASVASAVGEGAMAVRLIHDYLALLDGAHPA